MVAMAALVVLILHMAAKLQLKGRLAQLLSPLLRYSTMKLDGHSPIRLQSAKLGGSLMTTVGSITDTMMVIKATMVLSSYAGMKRKDTT
jgi:hypothetical protein